MGRQSAARLTDPKWQGIARSFDIQGFRLTATGRLLHVDGTVPCYEMKKLAGTAFGRVAVPLRVVNRLRVVPQRHRRDAELEEAVREALAARHGLAAQRIAVSVSEGIVTLHGQVSSPALRGEAECAAWSVGGVVDVVNQLRAGPAPVKNGKLSKHD